MLLYETIIDVAADCLYKSRYFIDGIINKKVNLL